MKQAFCLTLGCGLLFLFASFRVENYSSLYYRLDKHTLNRKNDNDSVIVSKIIDKLFELPEVKSKNRFVDSLTNHGKGVSMRVMKVPDKWKKYYWIAVGYNNDLRFETCYNFYVWPNGMIIKYLDSESDRVLTLAQWRESRRKNGNSM